MMSLNSSTLELEKVTCVNCNADNDVEVICTRSRHKGRCYGLPCRVVICKNCGLVYLNPRMSAKDYQEFYLLEYWQLNLSNLPQITSQHDSLAQEICKFYVENSPSLTPQSKILDIGCGTGEILGKIAQKTGAIGYGIEPSESAAQWATEQFGLTIIQKDFFDNQLQNAQFDAIIASAVLEHFLNPLDALREMRRLIKPGGTLFIRVPDLEACSFSTSEPATIFKIVHTYYFTNQTLAALLSRSGFQVVKVENKPPYPGESHGEIWLLAKEMGGKEQILGGQDYRQIIAYLGTARLKGFFPYWYRRTRKTARKNIGRFVRSILPANVYMALRSRNK